MTREDLLLPVQRQMIHRLGHDYLCQQTRTRRALFNRLRRLGGRLHRARTSIFLADILDYRQLCRNVFVTLARLFPDGMQILVTRGAVLFRIREVVHDALPFEMPGERLPTTALLVGSRPGAAAWRLIVV